MFPQKIPKGVNTYEKAQGTTHFFKFKNQKNINNVKWYSFAIIFSQIYKQYISVKQSYLPNFDKDHAIMS